MNIKAISLWEPWATAMAMNIKKVETRSWPTNYRGMLLICAAKKKMSNEAMEVHWIAESYGFKIEPHYGMAVAIVDLIRCDVITLFEPCSLEHALGDYRAGRFAWTTNLLKRLKNPFPVKGKQGFFNVDIPENLT